MTQNVITINGVPVHVDADIIASILLGAQKKESPLMADYVRDWYEHYKKPTLRPKTVIQYEWMLNCHIIPFFKDMKVGDVMTPDIQKFFDTMPNASRSTVKHMKDVLHQVFASAIEDGYAVKNPTESKRLVLPKKVKEREALTPEQLQKITFQMCRLKEPDKLLLMLLLYTGARRGEVLGLRWEDVDFEERIIHIRRAVVHVKNRPFVGETKTHNGLREVPLLPQLHDFLLQYNPKEGYIIGGKKEPITETAYRRMWERIDNKVELYGATAHVFRHTFLTMAAPLIDPKTLQAIAGHANYTLTMSRYVHKREDKIRESTDKLSDLYEWRICPDSNRGLLASKASALSN